MSGETCLDGACQGGDGIHCDDDPCATATCGEGPGGKPICVYTPVDNGKPCGFDFQNCAENLVCTNGECGWGPGTTENCPSDLKCCVVNGACVKDCGNNPQGCLGGGSNQCNTVGGDNCNGDYGCIGCTSPCPASAPDCISAVCNCDSGSCSGELSYCITTPGGYKVCGQCDPNADPTGCPYDWQICTPYGICMEP